MNHKYILKKVKKCNSVTVKLQSTIIFAKSYNKNKVIMKNYVKAIN